MDNAISFFAATIVFLFTTTILPMIINKTTEERLDWIKKHLRGLWTVVLAFYSFYLIYTQGAGVIMNLHETITGLKGYLVVAILGAILACGYWYLSGKIVKPSKKEKSPFAVTFPTYEQAKIIVCFPGGTSGGRIWPDTNILNGTTKTFYKTIYVIEVKNQSYEAKTIKGLRLQLLSWLPVHSGDKPMNLPIYRHKETTIDLNPGVSVLFEIAYQFSLTSTRPPTEQLPVELPPDVFYGIYNPLRDPKNKLGFLNFGRGDVWGCGTHIDELPQLSTIIQPARLQLSATDIPSQEIGLKISPDKERGFKLEAFDIHESK